MLERIHKITSVGLFNEIRPAAIRFKKISLIYGDNGRGKSTLASIMRSYTHSQPEVLISRKTLNSTIAQSVDIQFNNGNRAKFESHRWDNKFSDVHVFDLDFIDNNVYSGGEIKAGHRKKLLSFALGHAAVTAMTEFNSATEKSSECTRQRKLIEAQLQGYRGATTLTKYIKIKKVDNIDELLATNTTKQVMANRIGIIKAKNKAKKLTSFVVDFADFFSIINKTIEQINIGAEEKVKRHLECINSEGAEKWVSDGQIYIIENICPFCSQQLGQNELIAAYKAYFNKAYIDFIKEVTTLQYKKDALLKKLNVPLLRQEYDTACEVYSSWDEYLKLELKKPDFDHFDALKIQLDSKLSEYIARKNSDPSITLPQAQLDDCNNLVSNINEIITNCNNEIDTLNTQIDDYKESLETIDIGALVTEQNNLNTVKTRFTNEVIQLISDYENKKAEESKANEDKEKKRETLNQIMSSTLGRYETSINQLLNKFGASFCIKEINFNYNGGGEPKSEYAIELRGQKITLQGDDAGFRTCLSEGDKRTLAFAFFVSVILADSDLENKIVLIDDPMCSFDSHRKQQTITILKDIFDQSKQLIILAHDAFFIKTLKDEFHKKGEENNLSLIKIAHAAGGFSDLLNLDIDRECESAYYKNHRLVSEYINGTQHNERDVATAIRPLLEGYLHRRFPTHIAPGFLFGAIVQLISNSPVGSPLHHAISLTAELNAINSFAGRFHHDTNPNAGSETVPVGELLNYCQRSLDIIYKGVI